MPIYEYQCKQCGQTTEALQKFSDKPLSKCPNCGGKLEKLMSMNSFQLKGGGWYVTDYAKKDGASACSSTSHKPNAAPKCEAAGCKAEACPAKSSDKKE